MDTVDLFLDIAATRQRYPSLLLYEAKEYPPVLRGWIPIRNELTGDVVDTVSVIIRYTPYYPNGFPLVYEIGGRFPKNRRSDLHINADGSLCLDVIQNEIMSTKDGMDTLLFIDKVLIPNLSWRICVLEDIPFNKQEYAHNFEGNLEFYQELLRTGSDFLIFHSIRKYLTQELPKKNDRCFCNSGMPYRKCHKKSIELMAELGDKQLFNDLKILYRRLKNKNAI